ncbi:MAG: tetratricopeptide repeat protein [Armatimonadota bacterium]|nr:tetratricopeptide repeat protein [Armatimonadota bacterium]MDR5696714.1 tetratricopeptide repeat protein [Armatimonadota bacterium]
MPSLEFVEALARGEELLDQDDLRQAEASLRQAVELDPNSARARSKLGVALARQGRYEEAIEQFRRSLEADPLHAPAYSNLGTVYQEQGRTEEAMAAYRKAIEVDPDYWVAHQNLAALYKRQGNYVEFVRHIKKATRLAAKADPKRRSHTGDVPRRTGCLPAVALPAVIAAAWLVAGRGG